MSTALSLALVALLGLLTRGAPQDPALDAAPAGVPLPELPGLERSEPYLSPQGVRLERNAALADRFTAPGQSVRYPFESRAGELSLFELPTVGYARGWSAAARLRVLDAAGAILAEQVLAGGVEFRPLLAFTAPAAGTFTLELSAEREYFRYQLVRHSSYLARDGGTVLSLDASERVHGWLAGGDDQVRFRIPARAGEEIVLRVEGTREKARAQRQVTRSALLDNDSGPRMSGESMRSMTRAAAPVFAEPRLELVSDAGLLARGESFARLLPGTDGELELTVAGDGSPQALLFDLVVLRAPACVPVAGLVIDADDEPLPGCALEFLLEPELDPWARATSDAQGRYSIALPVGDWRIRMQSPTGNVRQLRAGIVGPTSDQVLLFP